MVMKLRTCRSSSQEVVKRRRCTSNSQEVVLDEEDLLTLILLCVPYRKLMSFKSVSKKWLSLITNPHFTRLLRNLLPPLRASGLFIQRPPEIGFPDKVYFVPLDDKNITSPSKPSLLPMTLLILKIFVFCNPVRAFYCALVPFLVLAESVTVMYITPPPIT